MHDNYEDTEKLLDWVYNQDEESLADGSTKNYLRGLLFHKSEDVREVTIMRLACRAHDTSIKAFLRHVLLVNENPDLVFSAAVKGLVCLSKERVEREESKLFFKKLLGHQSSAEKIGLINEALLDLGLR
ncbi:MAG: hypothetical protein AB8B54_05595 [Sphingorhabdus sp.]